jgi:crotonobetainyl-CoA:carnitine CoA-transferase CaiB-like acyl-CoA transferase
MADLPEYATHELRFKSITALNELAAQWIRNNPIEVVTGALEKNGLPYSIVLTIEDIMTDPHYAARQNIVTVDHPKLGPLKMQGVIPKLSETPGVPVTAAPEIGQHNCEIYRSLLGMNEQDMSRLAEEGVI